MNTVSSVVFAIILLGCMAVSTAEPKEIPLWPEGEPEPRVPAELHIYEAGGHGFGMQKRDNAAGTSDWPNRALDWLRGRGL
jgi:hypothetical protein